MNNQSIDLITEASLDQVTGGLDCDAAMAAARALRDMASIIFSLPGNNPTNAIIAGSLNGTAKGLVLGACPQ